MARRRRTAAQIAASRRNVIKAQKRSAELRHARAATAGTKAKKFYSGPTPTRRRTQMRRRAARQQARDTAQDAIQTAKNAIAIGTVAVSGATLAVSAYKVYADNPEVKKSIDMAVKRGRALATGKKLKTGKPSPTMRTPSKPRRVK